MMKLQSTGLPYTIVPVKIGAGEQFKPEHIAEQPDSGHHRPQTGRRRRAHHRFRVRRYPPLSRRKNRPLHSLGFAWRVEVLQWLFWQMAGLGPMAGQNHHFSQYAPEKIPYAIERYVKETNRLYGVLNKRLADRPFVAGDYSIADMAAYPWIVPHKRQGQNLDDFPHLNRWFEEIKARPATVRAYERANEINTEPTMSEEAKKGSLRADGDGREELTGYCISFTTSGEPRSRVTK